jgi:hypothetical protein
MKFALTPRRILLGVSLVASVAGAFSVSGESGDESVVGATTPHARSNVDGIEKSGPARGVDGVRAEPGSAAGTKAHASGERVALIKLVSRHFDTAGDDLFSVPASLQPQKLVDVKPVAPPLPFKFLGRITDGDLVSVLLGTGDSDTVVVHEGDPVGNKYRLETVRADALTFVYLPLQQQQTLSLEREPADSPSPAVPPVDSQHATSQKNAKR